jgi:GTP-binding protein HflX
VAERLGGGYVEVELITHTGNGRLFAWLAKHAESEVRTYTDESASRVRIRCRIPRRFVRHIPPEDVQVVSRNPTCINTDPLPAESEQCVTEQ